MLKPFQISFFNIILRGFSLISKLLFLIYAGKKLALVEMGVYGLVNTTISVIITVLGFEFYAFSNREMLARPNTDHTVILRDQFVFYCIMYLTILPFTIFIFLAKILPWSLTFWLFGLVFLEHLAQELSRIMNTLFRPLLSNALFFLRNSGWCLPLIFFWYRGSNWITLQHILFAWTIGVFISLIIFLIELRHLDWSKWFKSNIDYKWIKSGMLVAAPFMISALSYRIIELADRYIIHFLVNDESVGIYSFYATIANVIPAIVGASLSSIYVPKIVHAYQVGNFTDYHIFYKKLNYGTLALISVASPFIYVICLKLIPYIGKTEYIKGLPTFIVLLFSTIISAFAQLPGIALYAQKKDLALLFSTLIGGGANVVLNIILIPKYGIMGAAWATAISYGLMGLYQLYATWKSSPMANPYLRVR